MRIFVVADTHFNHENIIRYCNRPFNNVYEMNEKIIENWNSVVEKDDTVYHLGDYGFGKKEELQEIFNRLNGIKYLIMGNHDIRFGKKYYLDIGFLEVYKKFYELDKYIFSHYPIMVPSNKINVYGHIHDKPVVEKYDDEKHMCVSLERINYTPKLLIRKKV